MGHKSNKIEDIYEEDSEEFPEDDELKTNSAIKSLINRHGLSMWAHSREYTLLLKAYIENSRESSRQKKYFKVIFFAIAILILVGSFGLFFGVSIRLVSKDLSDISITTLSGIISSVVGLLSLYIIIPEIIAKYLFNSEEDKSMTTIVQSIQDYDRSVFSSINIYNQDKTDDNSMKDIIKKIKEEISKGNSVNGNRSKVQ